MRYKPARIDYDGAVDFYEPLIVLLKRIEKSAPIRSVAVSNAITELLGSANYCSVEWLRKITIPSHRHTITNLLDQSGLLKIDEKTRQAEMAIRISAYLQNQKASVHRADFLIIESYLRWRLLARALRRTSIIEKTHYKYLRQSIWPALSFCRWLKANEKQLSSATEIDYLRWFSQNSSQANKAVAFMRWLWDSNTLKIYRPMGLLNASSRPCLGEDEVIATIERLRSDQSIPLQLRAMCSLMCVGYTGPQIVALERSSFSHADGAIKRPDRPSYPLPKWVIELLKQHCAETEEGWRHPHLLFFSKLSFGPQCRQAMGASFCQYKLPGQRLRNSFLLYAMQDSTMVSLLVHTLGLRPLTGWRWQKSVGGKQARYMAIAGMRKRRNA